MDTVGHGVERDVRLGPPRVEHFEDSPADLRVPSTHGVDRTTAASRQPRHAERLPRVEAIGAAKREHVLERDAEFIPHVRTQVRGDELWAEAIEPGFDGRMRREDIAGARGRQRHLEGNARIAHEFAGSLEGHERRMPFVQMAHLRAKASGA